MRDIFSDHHRLQCMLDFEAALARALAQTGIAPANVTTIEKYCDSSRFDLETLARDTVQAGNVAIPMLKVLASMVAEEDETAAGFVHWGATSQDAIDTGLVLQLRGALDVFEADLSSLSTRLARLAKEHASTLLAGRTWLQQGPPVTLGLKAAGWLSAVDRHRARLARASRQASVIQFGGAVGTLAALDDRGLQVAVVIAKELNLAAPDLPWHAHRDRLVDVAATLGLLVGTLGKIARDVSLMAQTEIDEATEPHADGRGGSSTMPHKRNPVSSAVVLAASIRVPPLVCAMFTAMVQEHERGLGGWQAEWETLPEICKLAAGALSHVAQIIDGLEVHEDSMQRNLDVTRGLILSEAVSFALAKHTGKSRAHEIVEKASRRAIEQEMHLRDALLADREVTAHLSADDLAGLFDARNYLGSAEQMIRNVLAAHDSFSPDGN